MARKSSSAHRRWHRRASGSGMDYVALLLIGIGALALVALALSGVHVLRAGAVADRASATSVPTQTPSPASTPTPPPPAPSVAPVAVSLLADASASGEGSWWRQSVGADAVAGFVPSASGSAGTDGAADATGAGTDGVIGGIANATTGELRESLEAGPATTIEGVVIVQAGAADLQNGAAPAEVATGIQALWQAIADRGGRPVAALVPPSQSYADEVVALNAILTVRAQTAGIAVLDLHTPVGTVDGGWGEGFSDDGVQPNAEGSRVLAATVVAQLPVVLAEPAPTSATPARTATTPPVPTDAVPTEK